MNIFVQNNAARRGYEVYIDRRLGDSVEVAHGINFSKADLYAFTPPLLTITQQECIILMDSLWGAGIRPTNGEGSVGMLGALQQHLQDMRTLVSHYSKAKL